MTEHVQENKQDLDQQEKESGSVDELLSLKKTFAKDYFAKLQKESGSLPGLLLSETGTVEDYLTSEGILDAIKDKVVLGTILQRVLEKETMNKLDAVKNKIQTISSKDKIQVASDLNRLREEVGLDNITPVAPIIDTPKIQEQQKQVDQSINELVEDEKLSSKSEKLLAILDKILLYDKNNNVKYSRGGREHLSTGLDCSGLIIYALRQIGLKEMGGDSRAMFSSLKTDKLILDDNKSLSKDVKIEPGSLLFWDSKNTKYKFSTGAIPKTEKDGENYRIHHVAVIKAVDYDSGEITVIESNGVNGVVERKISLEEEKNKKHKSDLYVGHVDYNKLMAYNGPKENVLNAA